MSEGNRLKAQDDKGYKLEILKAEVDTLAMVLNSLCKNELSCGGRQLLNKMIKDKQRSIGREQRKNKGCGK